MDLSRPQGGDIQLLLGDVRHKMSVSQSCGSNVIQLWLL